MNFKEFYSKVTEMKYALQKQFVNADEVKIEHTKLDGYDCLWAMKDDEVLYYFKW